MDRLLLFFIYRILFQSFVVNLESFSYLYTKQYYLMKTIYTNRFFVLLICLLLSACSKDNEQDLDGYCRFSETSIDIPSEAGSENVTVEWSYSQWTISTETNGFLTSITPISGGSKDGVDKQTTIHFTYPNNPTTAQRTQDIIVTNSNTGLQEKITIVQAAGQAVHITIDAGTKYQKVTGFGGMNNVWAAGAISENEIAKMFGAQALGYNIIRIMVHPDKNNWSRDVASTKKAQSLGAIVMATPWTPPANLKSNNSTTGGYLLPANYATYAEYLKSFVDYMASQGVTVDAISIQNEPDIRVTYDSCDWTPEQILEFIKNHARNIGDNVKIVASESFNFNRSYTDQLLSDPVAVNNFDIVGGHIYGNGLSPYDAAQNKNKEVWMTEHLENEGWSQSNIWNASIEFAKEVHDCMEANFNAYIWWYLKRFYSMMGEGEEGSTLGEITKRGYVMAHYAKYATGYERVKVTIANNEDMLVTGYVSAQSMTLVMINRNTQPLSEVKITLPVAANSVTGIETNATSNMANKSVQLSDDKLSAKLMLTPQSVASVKFEW